MISQKSLIVALCLSMALVATEAFAPMAQISSPSVLAAEHPVQALKATPLLSDAVSSSSVDISAATLDPTTILSDLLAGLIGTPAILLVPIVAALSVAGVIAFFIVSYANPEVEDDE